VRRSERAEGYAVTIEWPIHIVVQGKAQPAGSKDAFVIPGTNRASVVDANPHLKPWQVTVSWEARDQYRGKPMTCAVDVEIVVVRKWRTGDYGTGRNAGVLKDHAPLQPTTAPDVLKLARGIEDALTGIVYQDDALIVNEFLQKRYGHEPRVEIRVRPTALTCVRDLLLLGADAPARPSELHEFEQLSLVA
jgi:Holliday junction resolvase RusA-like endonuclease